MKDHRTPTKEVVDAVMFLLKQPDARKFRKHAQSLIRPKTPRPPMGDKLDYSSFDNYVLVAAQQRRAELDIIGAAIIVDLPYGNPQGLDSSSKINNEGGIPSPHCSDSIRKIIEDAACNNKCNVTFSCCATPRDT